MARKHRMQWWWRSVLILAVARLLFSGSVCSAAAAPTAIEADSDDLSAQSDWLPSTSLPRSSPHSGVELNMDLLDPAEVALHRSALWTPTAEQAATIAKNLREDSRRARRMRSYGSAGTAVNDTSDLRVGAFVTDDGAQAAYGFFYRRDWGLWASAINARFGGLVVGGVRRRVSVSFFNVGTGDVGVATAVMSRVMIDRANGTFVAFLGPTTTAFTVVFFSMCEQISALCTGSGQSDIIGQCPFPPSASLAPDCLDKLPFSRRFSSFSAFPPASRLMESVSIIMKFAGVRTLALVTGGDLASNYIVQGGQRSAEAANINVLTLQTLAPTADAAAALVSQLIALSNGDLDALAISSTNGLVCIALMNALRSAGFRPKMMLMWFCPVGSPDFITAIGPDAHYGLLSSGSWDPRLRIRVDPRVYTSDPWPSTTMVANNVTLINTDAPQVYSAAYAAAYNSPAYGYDYSISQVLPVQKALERLPAGIDPYDAVHAGPLMRAVVDSLNDDSCVGRLSYDPVGFTQVTVLAAQFSSVAGQYDLLYPLDSATANLIYPLPQWAELQSDLGYLNGIWIQAGYGAQWSTRPMEVAVVVIVSVCLGIVALFAVLLWLYRETRVMIAAARRFLALILCGCAGMLVSLYTWTLYETTASCNAHIVIFNLSYTTFFAPVFARVWRMFKIFESKELRVLSLSDARLMGTIVLPAILADGIYLAIWLSAAPVTSQLIVPDALRIQYNYAACHYSDAFRGFLYAAIAVKAAVLVAGCVLAYLARGAPSQYNESAAIGATVYNTLFSSAILIPLVQSDALSVSSRFLVRSLGITGAVMLSLAFLFAPKFIAVHSNQSDEDASGLQFNFGTNSKRKTTGGNSGGGGSGRDRSSFAAQPTIAVGSPREVPLSGGRGSLSVGGDDDLESQIRRVEAQLAQLKSRRARARSISGAATLAVPAAASPPPTIELSRAGNSDVMDSPQLKSAVPLVSLDSAARRSSTSELPASALAIAASNGHAVPAVETDGAVTWHV